MKKGGDDIKPSNLLSRDEHNTLHHLLGPRCQSMATTVVQLFLTEGPDHSQWRRKDAGVLCFVKDHLRRSYFFRLFCLTRRNLVWEQEVYNEMEYTAPRTWLHTFEAEFAMAAFNFASDDEADKFKITVHNQLAAKRQRRVDRRSRASLGSNEVVQGSMPNLPTANTATLNGPSYNKHHRSTSSGGAAKKKDKGKIKIRKEDIGLPKDFRHVSHVGWDPNKGFDVDVDASEDPFIKKFFEKAGVSETQLKDKDTRQFIYDFIYKNGGLDAVKEEVIPAAPSRAPPVPSRAPPPPSATAKANANQTPYKPSPPRPPANVAQPRTAPPTPALQQRTAPPPPPPPSMMLPRAVNQEVRSQAPEAPGAPAPPPPPLPPAAEPIAAPVPPSQDSRSAIPPQDNRSALLAAIKSGPTLKHVEVEPKPSSGSDTRGVLLDQIRQGVELKSVQPNERPTGPSMPAEGLAGALARALAERNRAFHNDSDTDSDSSTGDEDSEWEE